MKGKGSRKCQKDRREEDGKIHSIDDQGHGIATNFFKLKARDRAGFRIASSFSASGYIAGR